LIPEAQEPEEVDQLNFSVQIQILQLFYYDLQEHILLQVQLIEAFDLQVINDKLDRK